MPIHPRVTAVLGPTNTGKTHYAVDRMLGHRTGVIGLPLRLLAREVYDRIVAARGPSVVALVTGEERIVPEHTAWWVCTVEAMPTGIGAEFVVVDEIQLCADPDRGHVFTDRLLNARGTVETMLLGSEAMKGAIASLVPGATFVKRDRFSALSWAGSKKVSRMPTRSAIVGFSVDQVYALAELIRRQKGGCAVVMGALSPRTRNAQVAMYQAGEVEYLVATDAIGMGLNLDIRHIAFSGTSKFDGHRVRALFPHELGQIAGRAGRYLTPGTFGVTGEARPFDDDLIHAIENHRFAPVRKLHWRSAVLDFGSVARLTDSLEVQPANEWLVRARDADDLLALRLLSALPEVAARLDGPQAVRLLWEVCCIPDFRGLGEGEHAALLGRVFAYLAEGRIPAQWLEPQVRRIDRAEGDIDTLSRRLAHIRTFTYISQRKGWVEDEAHWRDETRRVEDRLSDALHAALTQAFVDRRTSVLMRRLKQKESLLAEVNDKGEVSVEGEFAGRLDGFRFRQDASATADGAKTLRQAAVQALRPELHLRADKFYNAPDSEMDVTEQGGLMWGTAAVGKLVPGPETLKPGIEVFVDEDAGAEIAEKVRRRCQHFIDRKVATLFDPLLAMGRDETLVGLARGFAFRLTEALGVLPRSEVAEDVKALDQAARAALRKHGIRFGQYTIFQQTLLKPAPTRLRLVLWSLAKGLAEFPESPPPGLVTIPNIAEVPRGHYTLSGYHPAGTRAIRIDMLERLADILRTRDSRAGFEAVPEMLSITGLTLDQFADLMAGLGYKGEKGERPKARPEPAAPAVEVTAEAVAEAAAAAAAQAVVELEAAPAEVLPPDAAPEAEAAPVADVPAAPAEMEVFYSFTWAPRSFARPKPPRDRGDRPARSEAPADGEAIPEGKPREKRRPHKPRPKGEDRSKPQEPRGPKPDRGPRPEGKGQGERKPFEARPPRAEKPVDPDSPFAVLAALKGRV